MSTHILHLNKGETGKIGEDLSIKFAGNGHKKTKEGHPSPTTFSFDMRRNGEVNEEVNLSFHGSPPYAFDWGDRSFRITAYSYNIDLSLEWKEFTV